MEIRGAIVFAVLCAMSGQKYVWDILKPTMSAPEIINILINELPGESYPLMAQIPGTSKFNCAQNGPGFYADVDTQCQVFHRCDINGNMTSYLCTNMTLFNQITLVVIISLTLTAQSSQSMPISPIPVCTQTDRSSTLLPLTT